MASVVYSEAALADVERIVEFALASSHDSAANTLARIRSAVEILNAHPHIGRRVHSEMRELIVSEGATGYIALYRYDPVSDVVLVLRLRHQREAGYRP